MARYYDRIIQLTGQICPSVVSEWIDSQDDTVSSNFAGGNSQLFLGTQIKRALHKRVRDAQRDNFGPRQFRPARSCGKEKMPDLVISDLQARGEVSFLDSGSRSLGGLRSGRRKKDYTV